LALGHRTPANQTHSSEQQRHIYPKTSIRLHIATPLEF
jgi:hypothetical protein